MLLLLGISFTLPDWLGTLLILSSVILISSIPSNARGPLNAVDINHDDRAEEGKV